MEEQKYCSQLALQEAAPLCGSAVQVDLWLLIEYPRPWRPKALQDNELPAAVNETLASLPEQVAAISGQTLRVQFIKQSSSAQAARPRVFLADGEPRVPRMLAGELPDYAAIAELSSTDLAAFRLPGGRELNEAIYLVCTNGQRDRCCARFGLPLFEALRIEHGDRVWQTTHIGGHRYAPNLVCLPSGLVYGFVQPEEGPGLLASSDRGELSLPHLRGRAKYPPLVQAAEYFLRAALDNRSLQDLWCVEYADAADGTCQATFLDSRGSHHRVAVGIRPDARSVIASCNAEPRLVREFEMLELAPAGSAVGAA